LVRGQGHWRKNVAKVVDATSSEGFLQPWWAKENDNCHCL